MAHNHGNEYRITIVHEDGTEEQSEWMKSKEQVAQAVAAVHNPRGNTYWLRAQNVLCPDCLESEQKIVEFPLAVIPSQRFSPHDSRYRGAAGARNRFDAA